MPNVQKPSNATGSQPPRRSPGEGPVQSHNPESPDMSADREIEISALTPRQQAVLPARHELRRQVPRRRQPAPTTSATP